MEKIIPVTFENKYGNEQSEDAIVEYVEFLEDGVLSKEITAIYLPDGIALDQQAACRDQAVINFLEV